MAITNHERVGKVLDLLKDGLKPFIDREMKSAYGPGWAPKVKTILNDTRLVANAPDDTIEDVAVMLVLMDRIWGEVFKRVLGKAERSLVNELLDVRNRWAHQRTFSSDDAYRAMDSASRLLTAVSASQAAEVDRMKQEILRVRYEDQVRGEKRKSAGTAIESQVAGGLTPWRQIAMPHQDVASGRYQQAEFAADLWQVHLGEGGDEYKNPVEFFRRTFLTESLKRLLVGAVQRLSGAGGDPVVQLQTNFGGGKTHSMLALYHLISGRPATELLGVGEVLAEAGAEKLPQAKAVVLVGNKISPGNPSIKPDGTTVRTLWGELAWQLGGKKAFEKVRQDDERSTNPGDTLRTLFNEYGPCLVLIDEWVAYARQLHDQGDLPGGDFETQFTFAQALTESAKLAEKCLLVISLPASDTGTSPHAVANDVEVGGQRGREALARLQNVIGRVESSWRPASAEEGFEIVRRRLFEPIVTPEQFKGRDLVCRKFAELYRAQKQEFPPECSEGDYEKRMKAAYPIHPEVFDRLYTDWSTLVKFQRTRGVLRLMAAVIHSLWDKGDGNPLILPAHLPVDDPRVQFELTRYLPDQWAAIIDKDVDGSESLPQRIDGEVGNLGRYSASRRVARTIFLATAPVTGAANRGIEDRRVKLGCSMPGESTAVFGDALRRLAGAATYLYQDGQRYWYSTQPTVTKLAEDRAEQLKRDPDKVTREIEQRVRLDTRNTGDFHKVHALPKSGHDVPDEPEARLVVLGPEAPHEKGDTASSALAAAQTILEKRGNAPRLYRNALVFLAPDKGRLQDLEDAVRSYLAWESIEAEKDTLNLTPQQARQVETQKKAFNSTIAARMPETYQWLLVPMQPDPAKPERLEPIRMNGQDAMAVRASKKLKSEEQLVAGYAGTLLRMVIDKIPLWQGDHVSIRDLAEYFGRFVYLPRLKDSSVLFEAIRNGLKSLSWSKDTFAYADSYDEAAKRYRGLVAAQGFNVSADHCSGLLLKPEAALKQQAEEEAERPGATTIGPGKPVSPAGVPGVPEDGPAKPAGPVPPKRFYGTVELDPARVGRDAGRIAEEVLAHLAGIDGAVVKVTLEIQAQVPTGVPDDKVRIVTENCRVLKFSSQGFEQE